MLGPIDFVVVGFTENKFNGEILSALQKAVDDGVVRVVDLLFVMKNSDGSVTSAELSDIPEEFREAFSKVIAPDQQSLLGEEDVDEIGELLQPDASAGILVLEHLWAKDLKKAISNAGGTLIADGRIHPEVVEEVLEAQKSNGEVK